MMESTNSRNHWNHCSHHAFWCIPCFGRLQVIVSFWAKKTAGRTPDQIWAHAHKPCAEACAGVRLVKLFTLWSNRTKSAWRWKPSATCAKGCQQVSYVRDPKTAKQRNHRNDAKWRVSIEYYVYIYIYIYIWAISKTLGSRKGHPQIWEGPIAYHTFVQ